MKQRHEHGGWAFNCRIYGVHRCKHCGANYWLRPGEKADFCDPKNVKRKKIKTRKKE